MNETPFLMFNGIDQELVKSIKNKSSEQFIPKGTEILREGQYVKVVPIVINGLIKVYTRHEDKDLLLYYIKENESCIMSFSACLDNDKSKVYAETEEDTTVLLLPVSEVLKWIEKYPSMNTLFFRLYNLRYTELLDTIQHAIFNKMDKRLYDYLIEKSKAHDTNPIKISHRQIASELGTAREVITRVMKKLEVEEKVTQESGYIKIL